MITMKDFVNITNYRILHSEPCQWACFGADAMVFDSTSDSAEGNASVSAVVDKWSTEVMELIAVDETNDRFYRWVRPDLREAHAIQAKKFFSDIQWCDLETEEDILDKAYKIFRHEYYDTRISMPIDLPDDSVVTLMRIAHERDVTLNQLVDDMLREHIASLTGEHHWVGDGMSSHAGEYWFKCKNCGERDYVNGVGKHASLPTTGCDKRA